MNKSESIDELAKALVKFQGSMEAINKDSSNPFFKSTYASLDAIIDAVRKPLSDVGLAYVQLPCGTCGLRTILMHSSGQFVEEVYEMTPADSKPQSIGSALSYMRRYSLASILGLRMEDDDGNAVSTPTKKSGQKETWHRPRVVGTDTDDMPEPRARVLTKDEKKKVEIFALINEKVLIPLDTKEEYEEYVRTETQLELTPGNYDEIIKILKTLR